MKAPPFNNPEKKQELVRLINSIPGVRIKEELHRYPSIGLQTLAEGDRLQRFLQAMTWAVDEVRKVSSS